TVGKIVEREVLVGGQAPARNADPHHELPDLVVAALLALGGAVAVIALIDAVKFEEAVAGLVEGVRRVGEIARQMPAQLPALLLDRFGFRDCVERGHRSGSDRSAGEPVGGKGICRRWARCGQRAEYEGQPLVIPELADELGKFVVPGVKRALMSA